MDLMCFALARQIVAAHRIGAKINGKNRKVIIHFLNRKNAYLSIKNGKKTEILKKRKLQELFYKRKSMSRV